MYVLTEELKSRPVAIGPDHPLSRGYSVHLFTNSVHAADDVRIDHGELISFKGKCGANASLNRYDALNLYVITLDTRDQTFLRNIELITHESSHLLDAILKGCAFDMNSLDTELRAYYHDWIVGKLLHFFNPEMFNN